MRLRVHIGLSAVNYTFVELVPHTDADHRPAFDYIEDGRRIAISAVEYRAIRKNPNRFYCTTALKLHLRCRREGAKAPNGIK